MINSVGFRVHVCLMAFVLAAVFSVRSTLKQSYARQRTVFQSIAMDRGNRELANAWNRLAFTYGSASLLAETALNRLDWPSLRLADTQQALLKRRLREIFEYLGDPCFDNYYLTFWRYYGT